MPAAPGRPLTPIDPDASAAAALGAAVRKRRLEDGLTLAGLGVLCGYSSQHLSDLERGKGSVSRACIAALDAALGAEGALLALLKPAVLERAFAAQDRAAARAAATITDDVQPTNRRGLLEVATTTALGAAGVVAAPVAARDVDPGLVGHWMDLLNLLGQHDDAFGPHGVRGAVRRELRVIAEHRAVARGEVRTALMRVEACWSEFGAWLAHDCGDWCDRDALLDRALRLAQEAAYTDMQAWIRARQAQWSDDAVGAVRLAEAGLRTPRAGAHTRAMCATRAAYAHARSGDVEPASRSLAAAERLVSMDSAPLPPPGRGMTDLLIRRWEARCWAELDPAKGVVLYDAILRDQPRAWVREQGLYLAYVANTCADAGELDRARVEGQRALAIVKQTQSATAARELKRLQLTLAAA